jgi:hypothetical protein
MSAWTSMVSNYCTRKLTKSSDKLVAISAIAELYQPRPTDVYLAGLWNYDLHNQLCWAVAKDSISLRRPVERLPRPSQYRAPPWSWASVDVGTDTHIYDLKTIWEPCGAEIVKSDVTEYIPGETYSPVEFGCLTIKGQVQTFSWPYNEGELYLNEHMMFN